MVEFIAANPGFRSRIAFEFNFRGSVLGLGFRVWLGLGGVGLLGFNGFPGLCGLGLG